MDFHGMKRKRLQALCKKHGIPANLKNGEMANRLSLLFKVHIIVPFYSTSIFLITNKISSNDLFGKYYQMYLILLGRKHTHRK